MSLLSQLKALNQIEFVRHGKNYLAGNFMVQGLAFVSIPILTRMLNPDDYGMIAVFTSMVAIFSILLGLNFHGSINRKYYEQDDSFGEFIYSTTRFIFLFALAGVGLAVIFSSSITAFFEAPKLVFLLAVGVSFFSIFGNMYFSYLQASMQSRRFAILSFVQAFAILLLGVGLILWMSEKRYLGKLFANLAVVLAFFVFSIFQLRKLEKPKWAVGHVRYAMHLGVPLIPHTLSHFVLSSFDRIIINQLKDAAQAGLYSLAYNVGSLLMVVIGGLNSAWVPILFKNLNEGKYDSIQRKSDIYAVVIIFCGFCISIFAQEVVMVMASPQYYAALHIIPVIVLSSVFIFLYQLCVNYTFYVKKNIWISINTLVCGGLNIGLNYLFIPEYGYSAAAWTTLISYILLFLLNYFTARYFMKENMMKFGFKLAVLVVCSGLYFIASIISMFLNSFLLDLSFRVLLAALVFLIMILLIQSLNLAVKIHGGNHEKTD